MSYSNKNEKNDREVIGLIPAGGRAERITPLPCSKEIYPIGFWSMPGFDSPRPKAVCHYLLEKMALAGISKTYIVLRSGKWDIPDYLGDGNALNMHFAYLMMRLPYGVPYTIDQAYPFIKDNVVAFGFPDILFKPDNAYMHLLNRQRDTKADIVLGLFPVDQPSKWDMVDIDKNHKIRNIFIKPLKTHLRYAWIIAVWTHVFTQFIHDYLNSLPKTEQGNDEKSNIKRKKELYIGEVVDAAVLSKLCVEGVLLKRGFCLDIGTPHDLIKAMHHVNKDMFKRVTHAN